MQPASLEKFKRAVAEHHGDVALTNHTAFDNGIERISYRRVRMRHMPNIYILGEEGVLRFCKVFQSVLA